mgnify:CR=1 FL=1
MPLISCFIPIFSLLFLTTHCAACKIIFPDGRVQMLSLLHICCGISRHGPSPECAAVLLKAGHCPNVRSMDRSRQTPAHFLGKFLSNDPTHQRAQQLLRLLRYYGADLSLKDGDGYTMEDLAAPLHHMRIVISGEWNSIDAQY